MPDLPSLTENYVPMDNRTLLANSLNDMDDIFNFRIRDYEPDQGGASNSEDQNSGDKKSGGLKSDQGVRDESHDQSGNLREMEFDQMESFPDHKFKLYSGERLQDMVGSIREFGILSPIIVWRRNDKDKYTILSGHNRVNAGRLAGLSKGPVVIKQDLTCEEAALIVSETNLRQRSFSDLSYSERAFCLKQHYDALKSQGKRNDLLEEINILANQHEINENSTLSQNVIKLSSKEKVSDSYELTGNKITRYLRVATLVVPLLECLDQGKLGFVVAFHLSFVKEKTKQQLIADMIDQEGCKIDTKKAELIHGYAQKGNLTEELIRGIIRGERTRKVNNSAKTVKIKNAVIKKYFNEGQNPKEIEETIDKALALYFAGADTDKESLIE
jgi:ParB family chromosome partitioning protein